MLTSKSMLLVMCSTCKSSKVKPNYPLSPRPGYISPLRLDCCYSPTPPSPRMDMCLYKGTASFGPIGPKEEKKNLLSTSPSHITYKEINVSGL